MPQKGLTNYCSVDRGAFLKTSSKLHKRETEMEILDFLNHWWGSAAKLCTNVGGDWPIVWNFQEYVMFGKLNS